MRAALDGINTEGKTVDEVVKLVKEACLEEGTELVCCNSEKSKGAGARLTVYGLKCRLGMANRQAAHRQRDAGELHIPHVLVPESCRALYHRACFSPVAAKCRGICDDLA